MTLNLPYKVRALIYVSNVIITPIVGYLQSIEVIDEKLVALWTAEVAAAFLLAGLNVSKNN